MREFWLRGVSGLRNQPRGAVRPRCTCADPAGCRQAAIAFGTSARNRLLSFGESRDILAAAAPPLLAVACATDSVRVEPICSPTLDHRSADCDVEWRAAPDQLEWLRGNSASCHRA